MAETAVSFGKYPENANAVDSDWVFKYKNKDIQHHQLTNNTGTAILLAEGTDFNTITTAGFYRCYKPLHAPTVGSLSGWRYLRVTRHEDSWVLQEVSDYRGGTPAFRLKSDNVWNPWQYYAVQNKVAEFTAVNQTKVYSKTITMPYSGKATVTRIGNQVQITWLRAITNLNIDCEYSKMVETIPTGYRPACEVHMSLTGNVSNSVNAWSILHLAPNGSIRLTSAYKGNHVWTGTTTYLTTDPFPAE